jgi:hypothetical protein
MSADHPGRHQAKGGVSMVVGSGLLALLFIIVILVIIF